MHVFVSLLTLSAPLKFHLLISPPTPFATISCLSMPQSSESFLQFHCTAHYLLFQLVEVMSYSPSAAQGSCQSTGHKAALNRPYPLSIRLIEPKSVTVLFIWPPFCVCSAYKLHIWFQPKTRGCLSTGHTVLKRPIYKRSRLFQQQLVRYVYPAVFAQLGGSCL